MPQRPLLSLLSLLPRGGHCTDLAGSALEWDAVLSGACPLSTLCAGQFPFPMLYGCHCMDSPPLASPLPADGPRAFPVQAVHRTLPGLRGHTQEWNYVVLVAEVQRQHLPPNGFPE